MKKIIGIGLILVLFIPLIPKQSFAETNKEWKPDWVWYSLAAANLAAGIWDNTWSLDRYRKGEIGEGNPIIKYMFDTCPWAAPIYTIGTIGTIIVISYIINKSGWKPFGIQNIGYIILGVKLLTRGYVIYLNFII